MDETASKPSRPFLKIRPTAGWLELNLAEVWHFRDLLKVMTSRDLKLRYKQTILGILWVVLQPLLAATIFSMVFGRVAKFEPPPGMPYFVFAFVSMVGWNLFSQTLQKTSQCLVGNTQLVTKVYFPRLVLPLANAGSAFVDFVIAFGMTLIILAFTGHFPGVGILLLPIWVVLLVTIATGLGMITSSLAVQYRDINYIVPVFLQLMMYATPVGYGLFHMVNQGPKTKAFFHANPLTWILEAIRWSMLNGFGELNWAGIGYAAIIAVLLVIFGTIQFKRLERRFADVI